MKTMTRRARALNTASLAALLSAAGLLAAPPTARAEAAAERPSVIERDVAEVLVVAPRNQAAAVAPVKSSLSGGGAPGGDRPRLH